MPAGVHVGGVPADGGEDVAPSHAWDWLLMMWVPPHATHWMLLPMGYRSGVRGGVLLAACGRESAQSMRLLMWGASVPTSHGWRPASAWVISRC